MTLPGFGGGSSKSSSSSQSYLPIQATWLTSALNAYGPQLGTGQPIYTGDRVAGLTPQQLEAMDVGGWSNYLTPNLASNPIYQQTGQALGGLLSGQTGAEKITPDAINTLFEAAYAQPAMKQWNEVTKPQIQESFSGPGYWSTARMQAQSKGAQDLGDWLGTQYGQLAWNAQEANRAIDEAKAGRALSAIGAGTSYGMAPTQQATDAITGRGALYGLVSPEQQQQQAEINAAIERFAEANRLTDPEDLEILMQLLGMNYSSSKSKSSSWNASIGAGGGTEAQSAGSGG